MIDNPLKFPPIPENIPKVGIRVMNSGWVTWPKAMVLQNAVKELFRVPALLALLEHPTHGHVLFDTGYHTRFFDAVAKFPASLLGRATPAEIGPKGQALAQLADLGIKPADVKTILLSHGHADHVSGLEDFPQARIFIDGREWDRMNRWPILALRNAYVKALYRNIADRVTKITFRNSDGAYGPFKKALDIWGDRTMILVPLEGHTAGQTGLIVNSPEGKRFFFIGDAAHLLENIELDRPVGRHIQLIHHSNTRYRETLHFLHRLKKDNPEMMLIPSHCPKTWERLVAMELAVA